MGLSLFQNADGHICPTGPQNKKAAFPEVAFLFLII